MAGNSHLQAENWAYSAGASAPAVPRDFAESEHLIDAQLRRVARRVKLADIVARCCATLSLVTVLVFLAIVCDHWVFPRGLPPWGRAAALGLGLLVGLGGLFGPVLGILLRRVSPAFAALMIEQGVPWIKNALINFVLLRSEFRLARTRGGMSTGPNRGIGAGPAERPGSERPDDNPEDGRPAYFAASPEQDLRQKVLLSLGYTAAAQLARVPPHVTVDYSPAIRRAYLLVGLWALVLGYLVLSPKSVFVSLVRISRPWDVIPPATRVTIREVKPGDTAVEAGSKVTVQAVVRGLRRDEKVAVVFRPADGRLKEQEIVLSAVAGGHHFEGVLSGGESGIVEDLVYRVQAGDAESPEFRITVLPPVTLVPSRIRIQPPQYTGLPARVIEGVADFEGLEGSEIDMELQASEDLAEAILVGEPPLERRVPCRPLGGKEFSVLFSLPRVGPGVPRPISLTYSFSGRSKSGRGLRPNTQHRVDILPDRPPEIRVVNLSAEQIDLPLGGRLEIRLQAVDPDFGLSRVELWTERGGKSALYETLLDRADASKAFRGLWEGRAYFTPSELGLRPGDRLRLWAVAVDCRQPEPNRAESAKWDIRIGSPQNGSSAEGLLAQRDTADGAQTAAARGGGESTTGAATGQKPAQGERDETAAAEKPDPARSGGEAGGSGEASSAEGVLELKPLRPQSSKESETPSAELKDHRVVAPEAGGQPTLGPEGGPQAGKGRAGSERNSEGGQSPEVSQSPAASPAGDSNEASGTGRTQSWEDGGRESSQLAAAGDLAQAQSGEASASQSAGTTGQSGPETRPAGAAGPQSREEAGQGTGSGQPRGSFSPAEGSGTQGSSVNRVSPADPGEVFERILNYLSQNARGDGQLRQALQDLLSGKGEASPGQVTDGAQDRPRPEGQLARPEVTASSLQPNQRSPEGTTPPLEGSASKAAGQQIAKGPGTGPGGPSEAGNQTPPGGASQGPPSGGSPREGVTPGAMPIEGNERLSVDQSQAQGGPDSTGASGGDSRVGPRSADISGGNPPQGRGAPAARETVGSVDPSGPQAGQPQTSSPTDVEAGAESRGTPAKSVGNPSSNAQPAYGQQRLGEAGKPPAPSGELAGQVSPRQPGGKPSVVQETSELSSGPEAQIAMGGAERSMPPQKSVKVPAEGGGLGQPAGERAAETRPGSPAVTAPAPAEANLPRRGEASLPPGSQFRGNPEALSPSISRHQARATGELEGDRSGGGGAGGGQPAPQPGQGSGGQSSPGETGTPIVSPGGQELARAGGSPSAPSTAQVGSPSSAASARMAGAGKASTQGTAGSAQDQSTQGSGGGPQAAPQTPLLSTRTSSGGNPLVGGGPGPPGQRAPLPGTPPPVYRPDPVNLEYAEKVTALVLEYLGRQIQRGQSDKDLLEALGWSEEDLIRFYREWAELRQQALQGRDPSSAEGYRRALQALGLRPGARGLSPGSLPGKVPPVKQSDVPEPPPEWAEYFRAYRASVARGQ
ncbi:MAG: hypothetical protein NZ899_11740 [Thermoguttaceae bacterium]|nr:hypothetical protein [Thermoguttaceae bacterium]MDW8079379.1 hypothetical protein [Thermoguttaceae bacterium]